MGFSGLSNLIDYLKNNRYRSLKIKLFFIIGAIAGAPLIMVTGVAYFWLYGIAKEDFAIRFNEQIETTTLSMDFYISEKLSGLKFLASSYSYDSLSNQANLNNIFHLFKREFGDLVDLGVIDSNGIQRTYAGPYHLAGKDYSSQEWFQKTVIRGLFVSDAFTGYRGIPHFAIAVKKDNPSRGTFCILRATVDMQTLTKRIIAMNLSSAEDAFLVNSSNILQTESRFYGPAMERLPFDIVSTKGGFGSVEIKDLAKKEGYMGFKQLNNALWYLVILTRDTPHDKILELLSRNYSLVYLTLVVIFLCAIANYNITSRMVNWLRTSERNFESAVAQTEQAGKLASIGRLAAGVAHEVNNPLAIINEKAGLMKDILEITGEFPHKDKFIGLIAAISDSVSRCRAITHRLLGFARQMEVTIEPIDINHVISDVMQFLEKEIIYRDIKLNLSLQEGMPLIESDRGQLQQVFLNIINNAIDAVEQEGVISISTRVIDDKNISVNIQDNGCGIPKDKIRQIFEPFYTTKERGKGTGLGLSITYGIVQKLGGEIKVESELNKGTTFDVILPISRTFR